MLKQPLLHLLDHLRLHGMKQALSEQLAQDVAELSFDERLSLLLEREQVVRENKRLTLRLKQAKLKHSACVQDIDYQHSRGLDKSAIMALYDCQWVSTIVIF